MDTSDGLTQLLTALVAARKRFRPVVKESSAQIGAGRTYHYADLSAVIDATLPALLEHGLTVLQVVDAETSLLVTRLVHISGEWIESRYPLQFDQSPQQIGSALTYGRRYSLLALLCVAAEDDDGAAAQTAPPSSALGRRGGTKAISKAQIEKLWATARAHNWTDADVKKYLIFRYKATSSADIKADDFDGLLTQLEAGPPEEPPL